MKRNLQRPGFTLVEILAVITILFVLAGIAALSYSSSRIKACDAVAQEDLRQAYSSAMAFFIDNPDGILTESVLSQYGFRASRNVILSIIDGNPNSLLLLSRYNTAGTHAYITYSKGINSPGAPDGIWLAAVGGGPSGGNPTPASAGAQPGPAGEFGQKNNSVSADLLEKCNFLAKSALGEAFGAARSYFQSNPEGFLTKDILVSYGYTPHESVNLTIIDGSPSKLSMSANFDLPGATSFGIDGSGTIVPHS